MAINNTRGFIKHFELMTLNIYCIASHCTVDQSNSMHASLLGKLYTKNIHKSWPFITSLSKYHEVLWEYCLLIFRQCFLTCINMKTNKLCHAVTLWQQSYNQTHHHETLWSSLSQGSYSYSTLSTVALICVTVICF